MWVPLAYKDSSIMVSVLPLPYSQSLYYQPLFCRSLTRREENPRPITWATALGSFVVQHHKDPVHTECLPFIHNLVPSVYLIHL